MAIITLIQGINVSCYLYQKVNAVETIPSGGAAVFLIPSHHPFSCTLVWACAMS